MVNGKCGNMALQNSEPSHISSPPIVALSPLDMTTIAPTFDAADGALACNDKRLSSLKQLSLSQIPLRNVTSVDLCCNELTCGRCCIDSSLTRARAYAHVQ